MRRFSRVNRVLSFQVARFIAMSPGRNGTGVDEEGATCGPTRASSTEDDRGERERERKKYSACRSYETVQNLANRKTTGEQNRRQGPLWPDGDGKRSARKKRSLIYGPVARAASPRELRRSVLARTCSYACTYILLSILLLFSPRHSTCAHSNPDNTRTTDSHKERSPSGQCAAISIPRGGKLSRAKRERHLWKRHDLSPSLSSLSRYRSYRDCFLREARERGQRFSSPTRIVLLLHWMLLHGVCLSPSARGNPRRRSIDGSIAQDATDRFYQTKRTLVSPIQSGGSFLVGWVSLFFRSPPFIDVPPYVVMKGIMKGSRSLPLTRSVLLFPPPSLEERRCPLFSFHSSFASLCPALGLASGSRQRLH